jgi:hypothetical protein
MSSVLCKTYKHVKNIIIQTRCQCVMNYWWYRVVILLFCPFLAFVDYRPVCSPVPRGNTNSCNTSHNSIYHFLAMQRTTIRAYPSKISGILQGNFYLILTDPMMGIIFHHTFQQR